jgi:ATP-dependent DNA helicase DinG
MHDLDDVFASDGPLARALPDYTERREQRRMAQAVAQALERREPLLVEAGTGTGKTFAYLVPALLSGRRVVISTGTRTLQDQLFSKDLPLVARALGRPARIALLKGRANYLCLYRLEQADAQRAIEGLKPANRLLARVERWAKTTRSGDLSEVPGLADANAVWSLVTSTRENCLGARCPRYSACHVVAARRAAQEADIVIVNHHLLLADLTLKEDGFGDLLGAADAVILDEAHQIPDLATMFFGLSVSSRRVELLAQEARLELAKRGVAAVEAQNTTAEVEHALRELALRVPRAAGRLSWEESGAALELPAVGLADALDALAARLDTVGEEAAVALCAGRAREMAASLERIAHADTGEGARTVETTQRGFGLGLLPFDVSERFQALARRHASAWIFTSATLSIGEDFAHFAQRLGLADAPTLRIESPFDYQRQGRLYLPAGLPDPSSPVFTPAVVDTALPLIEAAGGGAFVLFTSHRALAAAADLVRRRWGESPPFPLFVQGAAPREQLLREFREAGNGVLLGTTSFWEGVDVKGEALRLVIIEKLPFASPDDPLVKARIRFLESQGGNAFRDYQLPEAVLALKQGVGRLIRSEEDYGVVAICDPRIVTRSYGRAFLASLPPFTATRDADEVRSFLRRHRENRDIACFPDPACGAGTTVPGK